MSGETVNTTDVSNHQDSTDGVNLLQDEFVLANEHPSWANWPKSIVLGGLFILGALSALIGGDFGAFFMSLIIAGAIFGYVYFARTKSRYIVTTQRVKKDIGLLRSTTGETRIKDIKSLTTNQGIIERLLGKGTVQIDSTGTGGTLGIQGVSNHEQLAQRIREQQRKVES